MSSQKMYVGLCSWHRAPNPCKFLSDKSTRSMFCSTEVTLDGSWTGAGSQKVQARIRSLEFSAPPPILQKGEGLEMELISDHAYVRSLHKIPTLVPGFGELPGWRTHPRREGDAPRLHRDRSSCARDPPRPRPMYLFICVLYHIL